MNEERKTKNEELERGTLNEERGRVGSFIRFFVRFPLGSEFVPFAVLVLRSSFFVLSS